MSGHGNSEEYRGWTEVIFDGDNLICPEESDNYLLLASKLETLFMKDA